MVIFSDGFESGDFSAWTGTTGSPTVSGTQKHHGSYAEYIDTNWEFCTYTFESALSEYYARCYIYFTGTLSDKQFISFLSDASPRARARIYLDGSDYKWQIAYTNADWGIDTVLSTATITANKWYCAELHWKADTAGGCTLKIDGVTVCTASGSTANTTAAGIRAGATEGTATTYYLDCVVISGSEIGPESVGGMQLFTLLNEMGY